MKEYLENQIEQKLLVPKTLNSIHLKRNDTKEILALEILEPTLNNTLVYLFSKAFGGDPDGVIVWDYELFHIEVLYSGEMLNLEEFDVKNLQSTVGISISIWMN